MISKIIQKEKERQEVYLNNSKEFNKKYKIKKEKIDWTCEVHKQSLINLKEYLEEEISEEKVFYGEPRNQLKEDIKELNKMIGRYE